MHLDLYHFLTLANVLGLIGGILYIGTLAMKTMVPLRAMCVASNVFLLSYGFLSNSYPSFIIYTLLLPINSVRLYQMVQLINRVKTAAAGDLSMDWLKPFMSKRKYNAGDVLFRKGDLANEMLYTVTGKYHLSKLGLELSSGEVIGEMGVVTTDHRRTQTIECIEGGEVLTIDYDQVRQLYFQNPKFGFFLLRLIGERMSRNMTLMEAKSASPSMILPDSHR